MSFQEHQQEDCPAAAHLPWRLVYARPRMERTAADHLQRQGYEAYLPLLKQCRSTPEGLQVAYEPLFPRYLFVRAADERQSLAPVASTRGAVGLVRFGGVAAEVPEAMVRDVRALESRRAGMSLEALSPIRPGARVRMRQGPLHGIEGLVLSVARQRVTFLFDMLGRSQQATVAPGALVAA